MKHFRDALKDVITQLHKRRRSLKPIKATIKDTKYTIVIKILMIGLYYDGVFITHIFLDHNDNSPDGEEAYLEHRINRLLCDKK